MDPSLLLAESGLTGALYGEEGQLASEQGAATAAGITAAGDQQEAALYGQASAIGQTNAQTELISGQLQQFQNTRNLMSTIGSQKAGYSAAGFQDTGTTLSVARSSLQQGLLQNQILGENANIAAGGYLEQSAASAAEAQAASSAGSAASAAGATATTMAGITGAEVTATKGFLSQIPGGTAAATGKLNPVSQWEPGNPGQGVHII